ncbi:MAG: hypothetical protein ABIK09_07340 [Pseudomonadota bacterium]
MKRSIISAGSATHSLVLVLVALVGLAVGCNGGSAVSVPTFDIGGGEDTATDDNGGGGDLGVDGTPEDGGSSMDLPDIGGACHPGDGCFLDPCDENADCISSLCVTHMGDQVCTQECVEECPDGWTCQQVNVGPDVMFACVSNFPFLCMPCHQDLDCTATWGGQSVCVDYGEVGRFCGGTCADATPCPKGFACQQSSGTGGGASLQCVPEAGECACSKTSMKLGLSTTCSVVNGDGACEGLRVCTDDGLTDCDADTPAVEVCDGVDNDCDGVVDGVSVCDDGNPCTSDSCGGEGGCVHESLEGLNCDDGTACTIGDFCQGGICTGAAVSCDDGNPCTDDLCDTDGGCENPPNTDLCDDGEPCTVGDHCVNAACLGTPVPCNCATDADCEILEDGDVCNGILSCDTGEVPFKCKVNPATVVTCPPPAGLDAYCQTAQCDSKTGACSNGPTNEGMACTDDDACTLGDLCAAGFCTAQASLNCDDDDICTAEFCHAAAGCIYEPTVEKCDDGNPCTDGDYCEGGSCVALEVVDCDDGNLCTNDQCNPLLGCVHTNNTALCIDGDACTAPDQCKDGVCEPGIQVDCYDGNVCTNDSCEPAGGCVHTPNAASCDDGNSCTFGDHCAGGGCVPDEVVECDDGNPCTDDVCNLQQGCQHMNNTAPCQDGNACTGGDLCAGSVCIGGGAVTCDDGNVCTNDTCAPDTGCVYSPNTVGCNDGNACTTVDSCVGGACIGKTPPNCSDGNVCTDDACDPDTGCANPFNTNPCSDGDACTGNDTCAGGACAGAPISCDDGSVCTNDSCNPLSGCVNSANVAGCNDGNACTTVDTCAGGLCVGKTPPVCNDGDVCTDDTCDPETGCVTAFNTHPCDNGDPCSTGDTCFEGSCQAGPGALSCFDDDPCSQDTCTQGVGCEFPLIVPCCGNLLVDQGEACDDGNQAGADGCSANCKSDETCGNGILDPATELCDSINFPMLCHVGNFVCEANCQSIDTTGCTSWCGDGEIDTTFEACEPDLFFKVCYEGEFQCLVDCKVWDKVSCQSWCGDGVVNGGEDCDGTDFAVACPLTQCWCSSDCTFNIDETDGAAGWESGDFDGVNNEPEDVVDPLCLEPDTLCLDATQSSLQHIWIANANSHKVVRINVDTGVVEKDVTSHGMYPSRTAVVVTDGSVWVGNRAYSSPANTSNPAHSNMVHLTNDGDLICRADILGNVRAVGIDMNGDVWAGSWEQHKAYKVSGTLVDEDQSPPRCIILGSVDLDGCPYGAAGDSQGNMWFANNCNWASNYNPFIQSIERVDIDTVQSTGAFVAPSSLWGCFNVYGMTVDGAGRILVGSYACEGMFRYTPDTNTWEWLNTSSIGSPRGVVVDQNGYIYSAISNKGGTNRRHVIRVEPDFSSFEILDLGAPLVHPVGVAIDRNGRLWTAGRTSNTCARVDIEDWGNNPAVSHYPTNGSDPYTYSDMTGFQHLLFTNPEGTWTQNYDGGADTIYWKSAEWTGIEEPGVTDLAVRARSAATVAGLEQAGWTAWITDSPANLEGLPNLRWCQLQVRLQSNDSEKTPILTNLTIQWAK